MTLGRHLVVCLAIAAPAWAQIDARMLRHPTVSKTQIAFVYAGDIWVVSKLGGLAERLSTPKGEEQFPRFSPDGSLIGYSADYDGNLDIYVIPSIGGMPRRITHNPAPDRMLGWYPDGKAILFASNMSSGRDCFNQLYKVPTTGGLPEKLPVPYGEFGAISPDGQTLAYTPSTLDFRTWKRYRGGSTPDIWLFDLQKLTSRNLTRNDANDSQPMWHGSTIYFLSDRDKSKRANIWAQDLNTDAIRQVTHFETTDVRFPSIGTMELVFEADDRLYLLDLTTEQLREVKVQVVTDQASLRPRVENVAKLIQHPAISPRGQRALFEARGSILTVPPEHGITLNLNPSSGVAGRFPAWSPDGKTVAYFSDRSGEYELTLRPADGAGPERKLTSLGPGFRYRLLWSPDSKMLAFADNRMQIQIVEAATGLVTTVDKAPYLFQRKLEGFRPSWSADSRWLAYPREVEGRQTALFLYDTRTKSRHQVTSGFYNDESPAFDPEGNYLFLLTGRAFKPIYSDLDNTWVYADTTSVAAVALRRDVPSPLAARNDWDGGVERKSGAKEPKSEKPSDDARRDEQAPEPKSALPKPVEIDVAGFEERLVVLPPAAANYDHLASVSGKVVYRRLATKVLPGAKAAEGEKSPLVYYDVAERAEKTVLPDIDGFEVSADGKKALVWRREDYAIIDLRADQKMEKTLATKDLEIEVDPPSEWHQLFNDAWRFERDYFYDPGMHRVDWTTIRERYSHLLADAVTRWDVNFVIGEMIGELNSSHTSVGGGDLEAGPERGVGMLGADYALENGAYRIKKILRGAPWDSEVRSPLVEPGVNVQEGDYVLAVNRTPLDVSKDPWAAFQGLGKRTILLTVNSRPTPEGAREVIVETLDSEVRLRNLAWIEEMRKRVDAATAGHVGYVYVPDTGVNGQTELVRQFRGQYAKEGLIIDERFNTGGQIPDRFVELLNRPLYNYWAVRDGKDWQWPPVAHVGPQVMLINFYSGSGGDAFPLYFKNAGLGPLVGTRTWGGLIGVSGLPLLIDGGSVTAPAFGIYSTDGRWIVEGHGIDPDIEVVADPAQMTKGSDPQLERAIVEVQRMLADHSQQRPPRPQYPDRHGS